MCVCVETQHNDVHPPLQQKILTSFYNPNKAYINNCGESNRAEIYDDSNSINLVMTIDACLNTVTQELLRLISSSSE